MPVSEALLFQQRVRTRSGMRMLFFQQLNRRTKVQPSLFATKDERVIFIHKER
jgi:hypothetical protein